MPPAITDILLAEYEAIIASVGEDAADEPITAGLVRAGDWTEQGAREVLRLAPTYGISILCKALALASALQIEDGDSGL